LTAIRPPFDAHSTAIRQRYTTIRRHSLDGATAASVSAGSDVFRHCDLNDLSRTAVESKSNRCCNRRIGILALLCRWRPPQDGKVMNSGQVNWFDQSVESTGLNPIPIADQLPHSLSSVDSDVFELLHCLSFGLYLMCLHAVRHRV